jgi:hypothetical protein
MKSSWARIFRQIRPVWIEELETRPKTLKNFSLEKKVVLDFSLYTSVGLGIFF